MEGRLIGLNTAILSRSGGFQGIGFAIPSDLARHVIDSLVSTGKVVRGFLGVTIQDISQDLADQFQLKSNSGAVVPMSNRTAGRQRRIEDGDVILEFEGKPVKDSRQLKFAVAATAPGQKVKLGYLRDGKNEIATVTVGEIPRRKNRPSILPLARTMEFWTAWKSAILIRRPAKSSRCRPRAWRAGEQRRSLFRGGRGRPGPGDVIQEINHQPVRTADDAVSSPNTGASRKTLLKLWSHGAIHFLVVDETDSKPSS